MMSSEQLFWKKKKTRLGKTKCADLVLPQERWFSCGLYLVLLHEGWFSSGFLLVLPPEAKFSGGFYFFFADLVLPHLLIK